MITLCIPEASPSLNRLTGKHWAYHHRLRRHWSMLILVAKNHANIGDWQALEKAQVTVTREGYKLLDTDNYFGGLKCLLDSLKDHHLIVDDSPDHLTLSAGQRRISRSEYPRTLIVIQTAKE